MAKQGYFLQVTRGEMAAGKSSPVDEAGASQQEWPSHVQHLRTVTVISRLKPTQDCIQLDLHQEWVWSIQEEWVQSILL